MAKERHYKHEVGFYDQFWIVDGVAYALPNLGATSHDLRLKSGRAVSVPSAAIAEQMVRLARRLNEQKAKQMLADRRTCHRRRTIRQNRDRRKKALGEMTMAIVAYRTHCRTLYQMDDRPGLWMLHPKRRKTTMPCVEAVDTEAKFGRGRKKHRGGKLPCISTFRQLDEFEVDEAMEWIADRESALALQGDIPF